MNTLNRLFGVSALLLFFAQPGLAWAQVVADDVVCVRCVDRTDINFNAINSPRILNGSIQSQDIGADQVTAANIAPGAVGNSEIADGAITTAKLAPGAVTAAQLDLFNTIFIEASGTDTENCDAVRNTLSALTGGVSTVVILGPGVYDCGANGLDIPADVSLIGSGHQRTRITGGDGLVSFSGDNATLAQLSVVALSSNFTAAVNFLSPTPVANVEIREVFIQSDTSNGLAQIQGIGTAPGSCSDVTISNSQVAVGSVQQTAGGTFGIALRCSGQNRIDNVQVNAEGLDFVEGVRWDAPPSSSLRVSGSSLIATRVPGPSASSPLPFEARGSATMVVTATELSVPADPVLQGAVLCVSDYRSDGVSLVTNGLNGSGGCL